VLAGFLIDLAGLATGVTTLAVLIASMALLGEHALLKVRLQAP